MSTQVFVSLFLHSGVSSLDSLQPVCTHVCDCAVCPDGEEEGKWAKEFAPLHVACVRCFSAKLCRKQTSDWKAPVLLSLGTRPWSIPRQVEQTILHGRPEWLRAQADTLPTASRRVSGVSCSGGRRQPPSSVSRKPELIANQSNKVQLISKPISNFSCSSRLCLQGEKRGMEGLLAHASDCSVPSLPPASPPALLLPGRSSAKPGESVWCVNLCWESLYSGNVN